MAIKRNVAQQNQELKDEMRRTAAAFANHSTQFSWVTDVLKLHGLSAQTGILVRMFETPGQEGNIVGGIWLTKSKEFWSLRAVISRSDGSFLEIEEVENISSSVVVNQHVPGTGKSFGHLALEVFREGTPAKLGLPHQLQGGV
jgi:hypothetical protein